MNMENFGGKMKKIIRAGTLAVTTLLPHNAEARPPIKKENPQRQKYQKAFENADKQREWMADVVYSPEYKRKLIENEKMTPEELEERKKIVVNNEPVMANELNPLSSEYAGYYYEKNSPENPGEDIINPQKMAEKDRPYNQPNDPLEVHELAHAVTDMTNNMSKIAIDLYNEAYRGPKKDPKKSEKSNGSLNLKNGEYLGNPSELDARKKEFEYELIKLGVWRYGETFTQEHLKKALSLKKTGNLSQGSQDFLKYLGAKENEDLFIKIMNTIAENKQSGNQEVVA